MSLDPELSPREQDEFADEVARRLQALAAGSDPSDPQTWWRVARKLGCRLDIYRDPVGGYGTYAPDAGGEGTGLITLNTSQPAATQARVLVRLLAHHLMHWWVPAEGVPGDEPDPEDRKE